MDTLPFFSRIRGLERPRHYSRVLRGHLIAALGLALRPAYSQPEPGFNERVEARVLSHVNV